MSRYTQELHDAEIERLQAALKESHYCINKRIAELEGESDTYRQEYVRVGCENANLLRRIAELEANPLYDDRIALHQAYLDRGKRIAELEDERDTWDGHKVCELLRSDLATALARVETLEAMVERLEEDVIGGDACATSLHKENKRLRAEDKRIRPLWSAAEDRNWELSTTLRQIAANTCCETCQEAALVAKAALQEVDDE